MRRWKLDNQQRVSVDRHSNVHFEHFSNRTNVSLALTWRQFLNLNDVIMDLPTFENMRYYPLGKNLWLQHYEDSIQLYHCKYHKFFSFHDHSWKKYLRETHCLILSFIRHEALPCRQHAASNATSLQSQSGGDSSSITSQQTLSRASAHARRESEQRKKRANLPERDSSDTGSPFSFRGSVDALRATGDPESDMEEGEVCVIQLDREQFSDFESLK